MRPYEVVAVSQNTNNFGLRGVVVRGVMGDIWEFGANEIHVPVVGSVINAPNTIGRPCWLKLGFEIPRMVKDIDVRQPLHPPARRPRTKKGHKIRLTKSKA